jgi:hypothetical protein
VPGHPALLAERDFSRAAAATPPRPQTFPMPSPTKAFGIKVGTTVTFKSGLTNTGFVIDFGTENPFDHEGSIIGGSDRPIIVTAKHPGCFTCGSRGAPACVVLFP